MSSLWYWFGMTFGWKWALRIIPVKKKFEYPLMTDLRKRARYARETGADTIPIKWDEWFELIAVLNHPVDHNGNSVMVGAPEDCLILGFKVRIED